MKNKREGFTLIELISVVAVILVLMSIVVSSIGPAIKKSKKSVTKMIISKVEAAVRQYKYHFGYYPASIKYEHLGKPQYARGVGVLNPVLEFEDSKTDKSGSQNDWEYIDPWGTPLQFYWVGVGNSNDEETQYKKLIGQDNILEGTFLEKEEILYLIVDEKTLTFNQPKDVNDIQDLADDVLTHGFIVWSKGPDLITGTYDDIGNWGNERSKTL